MNNNAQPINVQPGQRVRMFYDVMMRKSDIYQVVSINDRNVRVASIASTSTWPRADFDQRVIGVVD
jgi:hypothetical protein